MKQMIKKIIYLLTVTSFILISCPVFSNAAEQNELNQSAKEQQQIDPFQNIANLFGVSNNDILVYKKQGIDIKELYKACLIAKAGNYSLKNVIEIKTKDNTWQAIALGLGVDIESIESIRQDIELTKLETKLNIPRKISLELLKQGYCEYDIAIAAQLAANLKQPIDEVIIFKDTNNTWYDVSKSLDINDATFKEDVKNVKEVFPNLRSGLPWEDFQ